MWILKEILPLQEIIENTNLYKTPKIWYINNQKGLLWDWCKNQLWKCKTFTSWEIEDG